MLKLLKNIAGLGSNVPQKPESTPNIHTAFKQQIKNPPEYTNLVTTHGERLFMRDLDGTYVIQVTRLLFEAFEMNTKRGVTYRYFTRARKETLKHCLGGVVLGVFLTTIIFKGLGVY